MIPNPYVGPRPLKKGQRLYGRDQEVEELLDLQMAERIVLLYSPSGAGKTSLLEAGLLPRMEKEGFRPLPVLRVSRLPAGDEMTTVPVANRYILSMLLYLEDELPAGASRIAPAELAAMKLTDYLKRQYESELEAAHQVLVFDQFEEILTLHPVAPLAGPDAADGGAGCQEKLFDADDEAKRAFFQQVGAALRDRRRWAIFAMREDYVAGLHPYLATVPTHFGNTYRLDLLDRKGALAAVTRPAHAQQVEFTAEAAEVLVNNLRLTRLASPHGTVKVFGPYIEPVQLQVVCFSLWDQLRPEPGQEIGLKAVEKLADPDQALMSYYDERVRTVAASFAGEGEREIRDWFDRRLITVQGLRGRVLQGDPGQTVSDRVVGALVNAHLIREDKRGGVTWFELAHDRLIDPVRKSNDAWGKAHLQPLQRMAAIWSAAGRPPDNYLLRHKELDEAEAWAAAHAAELNQRDKAFLEACRGHRERGEQNRIKERAAFLFYVVCAAIVVILCLASLSAFIWYQEVRLGEQNKELTTQDTQLRAANDRNDRKLEVFQCNDLSQAALDKADADAEFTVRQSLASLQLLKEVKKNRNKASLASSPADQEDNKKDAAAIEKANKRVVEVLNRGLQTLRLQQTLIGPDVGVNAVAYSPDGKWIASVSDDGMAKVWDAKTGASHRAFTHKKGENANDVAFSPDGKLIGTAGDDGMVKVWEMANPTEEPKYQLMGVAEAPEWDEASAVAFSPDGNRLAAGGSDGTVLIWNFSERGAEAQILPTGHAKKVRAVAFSPDGKLLVSASNDKTVKVWNTEACELLQTLGEDTAVPADLTSTPAASPTVKGPATHTEGVTALAFSKDGKYLATGSDDMTAIIWDVAIDNNKPAVPPIRWHYNFPHKSPVTGVAFSSDGTRLATTGRDMQVKIWDVTSHEGQPSLILRGHSDIVTGVAFASDNSDRLATSSDDRTVKVWDLGPRPERLAIATPDKISKTALSTDGVFVVTGNKNGNLTLWNPDLYSSPGRNKLTDASLSGHSKPIRAVAFSPDGKNLVTGSEDKTAIVWNLDSGQKVRTLEGHKAAIWDVAYSPSDGKNIAAGGQDGTVRFWDAASGKPLSDFKSMPLLKIYGIAYNQEGTRLAAGGALVTGTALGGARLTVWDLASGKPLPPLLGPTNTILGVAFSPDGQRLASAGMDGTPRLWNVAQTPSKEPMLLTPGPVEDWFLPPNHLLSVLTTMRLAVVSGWLTRIVFSPDGNCVVVCGYDGKIRVWNAMTGAEHRVLIGHQGPVWSAAFSPDGKRLATVGADGTARIWDADSGAEVCQWNAHLGGAYAVAFSNAGTFLATGGHDSTARVWDAANGKLLQTFNGQVAISAAAVHPQGKSFAVVRSDNVVVVFDGASGQPRVNLFSHQKPLQCIAYSPDGERIALADSNGTVEVWNAENGAPVKTFAEQSNPIHCLAFSGDGKRLLTGYSDRKAKVWDPETGRRLQTLAGPDAHSSVAQYGHATSVTAVAFSSGEGGLMATGGADYAVKLWKATGPEDDKVPPLLTFVGHNGSITALAFSRDGQRLASASEDKTVKVWSLNGTELFSFSIDDLAASALAFTQDGKRLMTVNANGIMRVYFLDVDELEHFAKEQIFQDEPPRP